MDQVFFRLQARLPQSTVRQITPDTSWTTDLAAIACTIDRVLSMTCVKWDPDTVEYIGNLLIDHQFDLLKAAFVERFDPETGVFQLTGILSDNYYKKLENMCPGNDSHTLVLCSLLYYFSCAAIDDYNNPTGESKIRAVRLRLDDLKQGSNFVPGTATTNVELVVVEMEVYEYWGPEEIRLARSMFPYLREVETVVRIPMWQQDEDGMESSVTGAGESESFLRTRILLVD